MKFLNQIKSCLSGNHKYNILNINGDFLTGKTNSISQLTDNTDFINDYHFYSYVNEWNKFNFSFDIAEEVLKNSNLSNDLFEKGETKYFKDSFFDNLNALNITNKDLFNYVTEYLILSTLTKSNDEFKNNVSAKIKNDLKKLLILNSFEVSVESLLADLFNKFYPLKDDISNVSEYLINSNPVKLLFVFDDLQILNFKLEQWLDIFNNYLTTKRITDFKIFNYEGDDSDITIGEFFNINTVIISRNRSYKYNHPDFSNNIIEKKYEKPIELGFEKFPFNNIEYLIEYYKSDENIKELDVVVQAVSKLLKYVPENYQKNIIFCSLFEEFDTLNFNLLNNQVIETDEFEQLISTLEFVSSGVINSFKESIRKYLLVIAKEIFKSFEIEKVKGTIEGIRNHIPDISTLEFELLRHLAYFAKFERQYLIENYFDNNSRITELIDKYIHLFERNNNIYSLKSEIKILFNEYNQLKDKYDLDDINESVSQYQSNYRAEINRRNNVLNNDVVNVSNDLEVLNSELSEMNLNLDNKSKEMISIQNNIKQIEEKLKPFRKTNTNRKKTINLVALVISVAVIFNSDRISEFIFDTKDNFDHVILFVLFVLLILYGNGLIRYFRTKLQSEELHILKQELKKNQDEQKKLSEEIEISTADIRAKKAKIEDLTLHIERSNSQILENKKKLIFD